MGFAGENESIMRAAWPKILSDEDKASLGISDEVVAYVEAKHELITAGRALRTQYGIAPSKQIHYVVLAADAAAEAKLLRDKADIASFLRAEPLDISCTSNVQGMPGTVVSIGAIHLPLAGLIDIPAELERIASEIEKNTKFLAGVNAKLSNEGFVSRAPEAVVEQQRTRKSELEAEIARLSSLAETLKSAE